MDFGETIDATLDLFKKNIRDFTITSVIVAGPALILSIILSVLNLATPEENENILVVIFMAITFAMSLVIAVFYMNSLIKLSSDYYLGLKTTFKDALRFSLKKFWKMCFALLAAAIALLLLMGLSVLAYFGVMAAGAGNIAAIIAAIVPMGFFTYYAFCFFLFPYIIVIEDLGIIDAFRRSRDLFRSSRNATLKVILIPYLINALTLVCVFIPFAGSFLVFLSYPLPIIAMTLVYYDIRIRYEGYDLMIQAEKLNSGIQQ
jgi:hypothetical protein